MALKIARGQVTIIDQNDAISLQAFIGSSQPLTQVFNKDTNTYAPSWAASPYLILTPSLYVSGKASVDQITSVGNASSLTPRYQERYGQVVQERHGHHLRTGFLYHRRLFRQICVDNKGESHERLRPAGTVRV